MSDLSAYNTALSHKTLSQELVCVCMFHAHAHTLTHSGRGIAHVSLGLYVHQHFIQRGNAKRNCNCISSQRKNTVHTHTHNKHTHMHTAREDMTFQFSIKESAFSSQRAVYVHAGKAFVVLTIHSACKQTCLRIHTHTRTLPLALLHSYKHTAGLIPDRRHARHHRQHCSAD